MTGTRWQCTVCLTGYDESPHVCDLPAAVQRLATELAAARKVVDLARKVDEAFSRDAPMMLVDPGAVAERKLEALRVALDALK